MMKHFTWKTGLALGLALIVIVASGSVFAEKPPWAGGEKGNPPPVRSDVQPADKDGLKHPYFTDRQRGIIHDYYAAQYRKGKKCPPGLAKKQNGCMPPGQAKKWALGRPLPEGVVYYDLPRKVVVELGPPPPNHKYVRVAQDILLLATGTRMVVDAIDNLTWDFNR
jgi:hypothetical protein